MWDLEESRRFGDDASYPDLRLQREWDGLDFREVHIFIVGQKRLQPLSLNMRTRTHTHTKQIYTSCI